MPSLSIIHSHPSIPKLKKQKKLMPKGTLRHFHQSCRAIKLFWICVSLDGTRPSRMVPSPTEASRVTTAAAAAVAGEEADDGVEHGHDAVDNGHDDAADAVDDGHDGAADSADHGLDLDRC